MRWLVEIMTLYWVAWPSCYETSPLLHDPRYVWTISIHAKPLSLLSEIRKSEPLGQLCIWLGKSSICYSLTFSRGRNLSWHTDVLLWRRGDVGKVKLFLLHSSMTWFSKNFFIAPIGFQDLFTGLLNSHKCTLICRWLSKLTFLWRNKDWQCLFCHFTGKMLIFPNWGLILLWFPLHSSKQG